MNSSPHQERLSRWFFPSLLLHLLIIFLLIMFEREQQAPSPEIIFFDDQTQPSAPTAPPVTRPTIQSTPDEKNDEVPFAIHLPKSSTFGMTSLVSEETKFAGDPQATTEKTEDEKESTHDIPEERAQEDVPIQNDQVREVVAETLPPEQKSPPPPPIEGPAETPVPQEQFAQKPPPEQKRKIKNFWGQATRSSSPISKNMSLTTLADGFLNYNKEARDSAVDINSKELALEPTLQKIGWFLQNSFHLHNKPVALNQDVRTNITLHLEIDEKGALLNCYLSPQTNVPALDRNLLRIAQGAAPFPPIPQHVLRNKKTLCIKIPIEVDARQGTHEYYFVFRG